jgi:hypothetical protein
MCDIVKYLITYLAAFVKKTQRKITIIKKIVQKCCYLALHGFDPDPTPQTLSQPTQATPHILKYTK